MLRKIIIYELNFEQKSNHKSSHKTSSSDDGKIIFVIYFQINHVYEKKKKC